MPESARLMRSILLLTKLLIEEHCVCPATLVNPTAVSSGGKVRRLCSLWLHTPVDGETGEQYN